MLHATDGRQLLLLPLAVPLPLPSAPRPAPSSTVAAPVSFPFPVPVPDPLDFAVNNKSSCACQSLFEKQPFGYEIGRGSKQISSSYSNSSHRSQSPPRSALSISGKWSTRRRRKAKWKKKLIFLLIFVPVNSKCLHSFIKRPLQWRLSLSLHLFLLPNPTPTTQLQLLHSDRIIHFRYCSSSTAAGGHFL